MDKLVENVSRTRVQLNGDSKLVKEMAEFVAYCRAVERDQQGTVEAKILWWVVLGMISERAYPSDHTLKNDGDPEMSK